MRFSTFQTNSIAILISVKFIKMKFDITKKYTAKKLPTKSNYRPWSSTGTPASVRVKLIVSLHKPPSMKT